jgi:hypothetical protein
VAASEKGFCEVRADEACDAGDEVGRHES